MSGQLSSKKDLTLWRFGSKLRMLVYTSAINGAERQGEFCCCVWRDETRFSYAEGEVTDGVTGAATG